MMNIRFLLVSGLCALLHNAVMIGGDRLGLHYVVLSLISFSLVVVVGFALHAYFTFKEEPSWGGFARYVAAMAANLPLSLGALFVLCSLLHLPMAVAAPTATVALLAWNYFAARWAVPKRLPSGKPE